ncbi:MAG TPA: ABC transporter substrate-binding protein [Actinomycetes bacterium]|jgi:osmoprotectant transport system substrate-binding protein|nr:ABC transporter substrate-binding protein [Actinomycetes bacterium]
MRHRWTIVAVLATLSLALAACGGSDNGSSAGSQQGGTKTVRLGYVDFTEQAVLSQIYGQALTKAGYNVEYQKYATRELADPALFSGKYDMLIEYAGSDLTFLGGTPSSDDQQVLADLKAKLQPKGVTVLEQAPMSDQQAITVTQATARKYSLETLSDLAKVAPQLVFGGPPECEDRVTCYKGMQQTYGIKFKEFKGLAQGAVKYQALLSNQIQVALSFSTDGIIAKQNLVVLDDDKKLFPPDHAVPVARTDFLGNAGSDFQSTVNKVSATITTDEITGLNAKVDLDNEDPEDVAGQFAQQKGLV